MVTLSGHLSLSLGQGSAEQGPGVLRALGNSGGRNLAIKESEAQRLSLLE